MGVFEPKSDDTSPKKLQESGWRNCVKVVIECDEKVGKSTCRFQREVWGRVAAEDERPVRVQVLQLSDSLKRRGICTSTCSRESLREASSLNDEIQAL